MVKLDKMALAILTPDAILYRPSSRDRIASGVSTEHSFIFCSVGSII